jgi:hypothetical protein
MNDEENVQTENARNNQAELLLACGVGRWIGGCILRCAVKEGFARDIHQPGATKMTAAHPRKQSEVSHNKADVPRADGCGNLERRYGIT